MRKHFTLCILFCGLFVVTTQAQNPVVPNAKMEDWHTVLTYEDPDEWNTTNVTVSFGAQPSVNKSTDAVDGSFAARLTGVTVPFIGAIPGAMGTGTVDVINFTFKGGFPISIGQPAALIGYYKYTPVGGDSCLIGAALTKWDAVGLKRDTIAVTGFLSSSQANYTLFSAPFFYYFPGEIPDSAIVYASTAKDFLAPNAGSELFVDDIDLSNAVGIIQVPQVQMSIFPNPADKNIQIELPAERHATNLSVATVDGKIMMEFETTSATTSNLSTADLAEGLYFVYAKNEEGKIVASGRFTVTH